MTDPTVEAWTRENARYTDARAEQAWAAEEITWGVFNVPESELHALPDPYRVPIVLCDLEGKTRKEAARQLGWAEGTVASRLARGRALLGKRLARHDEQRRHGLADD